MKSANTQSLVTWRRSALTPRPAASQSTARIASTIATCHGCGRKKIPTATTTTKKTRQRGSRSRSIRSAHVARVAERVAARLGPHREAVGLQADLDHLRLAARRVDRVDHVVVATR